MGVRARSTEWFHDREKATVALFRSIEQAEAAPATFGVYALALSERGDPKSARTADPKPAAQSQAAPSRRYAAGTPYRPYCPSALLSREHLLNGWYGMTLASTVAQIVRAEGPIHIDLVLERAKEVHAVKKAGSNVRANVESAIERAIKNKSVVLPSERSFLCSLDSALRTFRTPTDDCSRPLEWISAEEIALAVLYLVEDQFGMFRD